MSEVIGNPLTWAVRTLRGGSHHVEKGAGEVAGEDSAPIEIGTLKISDLKPALRKGAEDFMALRTDVMFIVVIYPIVGVLLTWFAVHRELLPLIFPLMAGFALLGPVAAIGLYEMSRRREQGLETGWGDAFNIMASPSFIPIVILGAYLAAIFLLWMIVAFALYQVTLGPENPASITAFIQDVFTTGAGWTMLIVGIAIGFAFAALVLAISLVSFPLLIDRHVGITKAVVTSVKITLKNPVSVAAWGATVVVFLGLGVATLFIGLIFALPILGHATWHLYRKAVVSPDRKPAT